MRGRDFVVDFIFITFDWLRTFNASLTEMTSLERKLLCDGRLDKPRGSPGRTALAWLIQECQQSTII